MFQELNEKAIKGLTIVVILLCVSYLILFYKTRFWNNTFIGTVDCSYCTVDEAVEKVKQGTKAIKCNFYFDNDIVEHPTYDEIGLVLEPKDFKELLKKQHSNFLSNRNYNINSVLHFDRNILKQYFKELPEMKAENMIIPQNARIVWNGKNFNIEPEKLGRQIDIEKAVDFAIAQLSNGGGEVYFTIITAHKPEVTTEDLASRKDYLNTILKSYLRFKLSDGNVVILNQNTIKTWIKEDEKYGYIVDVEKGTGEFIKMLAEKVESANKRSHLNQKLDEQAEKEAIYEALEQTGTVDVEMFYIK